MDTIYEFLWLFIIYSVLGWAVEVSFIALTKGELVNRGFLNGPLCPVYGFGMTCVLLLLEPISGNFFILFIGGMVICTAIECFAGWILDKLFHMRWWDYTSYPLNFHGYVCLGYSIMWGLGVVLVVRVIHPLIMGLVDLIPERYGVIPLCIVYVALIADLVVTLKTVIGITRSLGEMEKIADALNKLGDEMSQLVGTAVLDTSEKINEGREALNERGEKIAENSREFGERIAEGSKEFNERIAESSREFNERIAQSSKEMGERITKSNQERKDELQKSISEMESRNAALFKSLNQSRIIKAFPSMRRDSSSMRLSEEIKKLRARGDADKNKETEKDA